MNICSLNASYMILYTSYCITSGYPKYLVLPPPLILLLMKELRLSWSEPSVLWLRFFPLNIGLDSGYFVLSQDLVMDILRVLSTPDLEVRKKTLQLALDLVSSRNVEEVKL